VTVLVADADRDILDVLGYLLRREGYDVVLAHDGVETMDLWRSRDPELILLDPDLPRLNGWELCQWIRREANTPIIVLTAASNEDDIVRGLDLGADDYVTKPFSPRPLMARVRAVLRRSRERLEGQRKGREPITAGDLRLDPQMMTVERAGEAIALTPTEFKLLFELVLHEGQVLTNQVLTDRVWGYVGVDATSIVKGQIFNLRRKLRFSPSSPGCIHTIPGSGYTFRQRRPGDTRQ
jgi:DNA-binding response OmpR family regulator